MNMKIYEVYEISKILVNKTKNIILYNNFKDIFIKKISQKELHNFNNNFKYYLVNIKDYTIYNTIYLKTRCKNFNTEQLKEFLITNLKLNVISMKEITMKGGILC